MSRIVHIAAVLLVFLVLPGLCSAEPLMPQAPATISWLPHGYGERMYLDNTPWTRMKGLHGFRNTPDHVGSWSHPLWGWDKNGYYLGPQALDMDPAEFQLPIGLIYPENSPPLPPSRSVRKVTGHGY
ncbi:MAG: hypothetical protein RDU20_10035 [Desulfomonilaceae bacterium]|nr:hypothetical protein [Desulfomonilaceae bacterium]